MVSKLFSHKKFDSNLRNVESHKVLTFKPLKLLSFLYLLPFDSFLYVRKERMKVMDIYQKINYPQWWSILQSFWWPKLPCGIVEESNVFQTGLLFIYYFGFIFDTVLSNLYSSTVVLYNVIIIPFQSKYSYVVNKVDKFIYVSLVIVISITKYYYRIIIRRQVASTVVVYVYLKF